jgi:DNA repair protein RadC
VLIAHERKALRDRFFEAGPTSLPDLEILELILFWALPRQDVKPLAKELLEAFGDFTRVVKNPIDRLRQHTGLTKALAIEFKIIEAAALRLARSKIMPRPVLSSWDALPDYCNTAMSHGETEKFRVLSRPQKCTDR